MTRRARHLTWAGAIVVAAIALAAAAASEAGSGADASYASADRGAMATGEHAQERANAVSDRRGLDRRDAVVAAAILAGALLMGFRGYVVIGAVIAAGAAVLGTGARLVTGKPKRRAWSDWPGTVEGRVAKQRDREPRPVRRPRAELH